MRGIESALTKLIGEFYDENRIFCDESDQNHQTDLTVNCEGSIDHSQRQ